MNPTVLEGIPEVEELCEWMKTNVIPSSLEDEEAMNDFCSIGCNLSDIDKREIIWNYVVFVVLPVNDLSKSGVIPILKKIPFYGDLVTENMKRKWKESTKILNHWFTRILQRIYIDYIRLSLTSQQTRQQFILPYYQLGCVIRIHPLRKTFEFHKDNSFVTGIIQLPAPGKIMTSSCLPTFYISDPTYKSGQSIQKIQQQSCVEEKNCVLRLHSRTGFYHKTPRKISTNQGVQYNWDKRTIRQRKQYYRQDKNKNNPFISFIFSNPRHVDETDFQHLKIFLSHFHHRQFLFYFHLILVLYIGYICFDVLRKLPSSVKTKNNPLFIILYSSLLIVLLNQLGAVFCIYRIFYFEIPILKTRKYDSSLLRRFIQSSIVFYSLFLFNFFYLVYLIHRPTYDNNNDNNNDNNYDNNNSNISTFFSFEKISVYLLYIIPFLILLYLNFTR